MPDACRSLSRVIVASDWSVSPRLRPRPTRGVLVADAFVAGAFAGLVGGTADSRLRPGGVTDRTRPRLAEGPRRPADGTKAEYSRRSPGSIIRRVSSSGVIPRAARL